MKKTKSPNNFQKNENIFFQLAKRYSTPKLVQQFIRGLQYNLDQTLYSAAKVLQHKKAHCLEGAFMAAAIMEHLDFEPMILSFESVDDLEHVVYVFQLNQKYGSIGKSRDPGLHGRAPVFNSIHDLAWSYFDPYIDSTGRLTAYQIAHLDEINVDWRFGKSHLWAADQYLVDLPHNPMPSSEKRYLKLKKNYEKVGAIQNGPNWW